MLARGALYRQCEDRREDGEGEEATRLHPTITTTQSAELEMALNVGDRQL